MNHDKLTAYQIAEAFPDESRAFIPKALNTLKALNIKYVEAIKNVDQMSIPEEKKEFYRTFIKAQIPATRAQLIRKYEEVLEILNRKNNKDQMEFDQEIKTARLKPIESLYSFQNVRITAERYKAICPFHHEKTPSFVIYKRTNTFHCFGCQQSGDAIDFYMKTNNTNFKDAIKALS